MRAGVNRFEQLASSNPLMAQIMSEFQCLKNKNKILDQLVAIKKFHIEPQVRDSLL